MFSRAAKRFCLWSSAVIVAGVAAAMAFYFADLNAGLNGDLNAVSTPVFAGVVSVSVVLRLKVFPPATTADAETISGDTSTSRDRLPWLDNLKLLLACIVVVAHSGLAFLGEYYLSVAWYPNWYRPTALALGVLLASFTVPLFFFISGYLAARAIAGRGPRKFAQEGRTWMVLGIFLLFFFVVDAALEMVSRAVFRNPSRGWHYFPSVGDKWYLLWLVVFDCVYVHTRAAADAAAHRVQQTGHDHRETAEDRRDSSTGCTPAVNSTQPIDATGPKSSTHGAADGQTKSAAPAAAGPVLKGPQQEVTKGPAQPQRERRLPSIWALVGTALAVSFLPLGLNSIYYLCSYRSRNAPPPPTPGDMPIGGPGDGFFCVLWYATGTTAFDQQWLSTHRDDTIVTPRHRRVSQVIVSVTAAAAFLLSFLLTAPSGPLVLADDLGFDVLFGVFTVAAAPAAVCCSILVVYVFQPASDSAQNRVEQSTGLNISQLSFGIYLFHSWTVTVAAWSFVKLVERVQMIDVVWDDYDYMSQTDFGNDGLVYAGVVYTALLGLMGAAGVTAVLGKVPFFSHVLGKHIWATKQQADKGKRQKTEGSASV